MYTSATRPQYYRYYQHCSYFCYRRRHHHHHHYYYYYLYFNRASVCKATEIRLSKMTHFPQLQRLSFKMFGSSDKFMFQCTYLKRIDFAFLHTWPVRRIPSPLIMFVHRVAAVHFFPQVFALSGLKDLRRFTTLGVPRYTEKDWRMDILWLLEYADILSVLQCVDIPSLLGYNYRHFVSTRMYGYSVTTRMYRHFVSARMYGYSVTTRMYRLSVLFRHY